MYKKILLLMLLARVSSAFPAYVGVITDVNWWHEGRNISGQLQEITSSATPNINQNLKSRSTDPGVEVGMIAGKKDIFSLALNVSASNQNVSDHIGYRQGGESYNLNEAIGWVLNTSVMPSLRLFSGLRLFGDAGVSVVEFKLHSNDAGAGYMGPTINETIWRPGFSAGAGLERYFFKYFLLKIGYVYQRFLPFSISTNDPPPAGIPVGNYAIDSKYSLRSNGVAASLNVVF